MRDLLVTAFVFASLPLIVRKPFFGILMWTLMGLMNPHKLCWGFALTIPFSQIIAITLFFSLLISSETKRLSSNSITILLGLFWLWMFITTIQAFSPESAWDQWSKVWRVMLLTFVTIMMLTSKVRIVSLVLVIIVSLGFYGIKGGIFTILTGGGYHVLGPGGTFISENNSLGLALVMTIPLMRFVQLQLIQKKTKWIMALAIALMLVAVAGSQSRGAFLGLIAMTSFLLLKSSKKGVLLVGLALLIPAILMFMPESWVARMESIQHYEHDPSAISRINAWITLWRIALDYPIFGGGFEVAWSWAWNVYSPRPEIHFDVHSIYFQILGEHGFVGFFLFLAIGALSFIKAGQIVRAGKRDERLSWMRDLASMIQVSIVGYATSGAFLGLAYFDFIYVLVALIIGLDILKRQYERDGVPEPDVTGLFPVAASPDSAATSPIGPQRDRRANVERRRRQPIVRKRNAVTAWYLSL